MRNWIFVLLVLSGIAISCKKPVLKLFGGLIETEVWEDRPLGISCSPELKDSTIVDNDLSYSTDHMLCVEVNMASQDFENMRQESRWGPPVSEDEGGSATAVFFEYFYQCDVAFPSEFNWYSGSINIDGITQSNVGLRKKGFLGSIFSDAPSFKVNTNKFISNTGFGSTHELTFNNNAEDPSRLYHILNYSIFQMANYPASPRCNLANVTFNEEALGVYTHLEPVNEQFLMRAFGNNTGHLYEGQLVDFKDNWIGRWDAKTDYTDEIGGPLLAINADFEISDDMQFLESISSHVNIYNFVKFWALEILINHGDGYCMGRNNFFIYFDPNDSYRVTFIPWGMNYVPSEYETSAGNFMLSLLPRRLSRIPEVRTQLVGELQNLLDNVYDEVALKTLMDQCALQVESAQQDANYASELSDVKSWIDSRRETVEDIINTDLPMGKEGTNGSCVGGGYE